GLVLEDNGGDDLTITKSGAFTFKTAVAGGATYKVTVKTQPATPSQNCSVTNAGGTATANVTNLQVTCGNIFTVGGSISGLMGTGMVLQDNGADNLTINGTGNVNFTFATPLPAGATYGVTILTQPSRPAQPCNVFNYTGIATANVSDVLVDCQHNDWNWKSWYIASTNKADNYATASVPTPPSADLNTPGGRDFGMTWSDSSGRKWLFGGFGFALKSSVGAQVPGLLNDMWVWEAGCPVLGTPGPCWLPAHPGPVVQST